MAMSCGHFADVKTQIARLSAFCCPPCNQPLEKHNQVMSHGFCACCGECWVFKEGAVVSVFHDGY